MKDAKDLKDENPNRYIILYNEIQDNMGNEIDFFINIKDKKERNAAVDYILQSNLWDYFDKIKFDYKNEYKTIYNDNYNVIGYAVRCCSVDKIGLYKDISKAKIESKKQYDLLNKNQNNQQINKTNNAQFNPQNINLNNAQFNPQNNFINNQQNNQQINKVNNAQFNQQNNFINNQLNNQQINMINNAQFNQQNNFINNAQNNQQINMINNAQNNQQNNFINNAQNNSLNKAPVVNPANNFKNISRNMDKDFQFNRIDNFKTKIDKNNYANNPELLVDAALSFLFSIDKLKIFFEKNKNIDFQSFKTIIMTNVGQNIKKMKTYEEIFSEILSKADPNNLISKDYYNQTQGYDEEKGRKKFLEKHDKSGILQKMFFIPLEEKIFCHKCRMDYFFFDYNKYIILKDSQINLLNKIILGKETETCEKNLCNFCNGNITKLTIEKECLNLPEWLIVIVEPTQINNLIINSFLYIIDKNNIIYNLHKFIEDKTNSLYYINTKNNEFCNKFDNIRFYDDEKISSKRPAVLFYYLNKNNINNNSENNIQKIPNNNNIINNNQINIEKNVNNINCSNINQQNIEQQKFNQNNITNINNNNMNQQNNNFQNLNKSNPAQPNNNNQNLNQQNFEQNGQNMNMNNNFINNNGNWMNMQNQNNFFNNNMMNNMFQNNNINNCINDINIGMNNLNMNMMNNMNNMNLMNNMNMQGNFSNNNELVNFNNIIVIQFTSTDQKIQRGIKCLPSHKFVEVEEKLYQIYPEYRTTNNSFVTDGRVVIKFQTIAENNIKDGQVVQLIREE